METLLHMVATPRGDASRTLTVSRSFFDGFVTTHPDWQVDTINLFEEELPPLTVTRVGGKYVLLGGGELTGDVKESWRGIERHIERFLAADAYLLSTPMWNFGVPYVLKHYIDVIVQPRYLFRYTESGPEGLVTGKQIVIITSRGGDYGPDGPAPELDYQEPYLRGVLGFIGLTNPIFVNAQPMDAMGPETRQAKLDEACETARQIGIKFPENV